MRNMFLLIIATIILFSCCTPQTDASSYEPRGISYFVSEMRKGYCAIAPHLTGKERWGKIDGQVDWYAGLKKDGQWILVIDGVLTRPAPSDIIITVDNKVVVDNETIYEGERPVAAMTANDPLIALNRLKSADTIATFKTLGGADGTKEF